MYWHFCYKTSSYTLYSRDCITISYMSTSSLNATMTHCKAPACRLAILECHQQIHHVTVKTSHLGTYIREIMLLIEYVTNDSNMPSPITAMVLIVPSLAKTYIIQDCYWHVCYISATAIMPSVLILKVNKIDRISQKKTLR